MGGHDPLETIVPDGLADVKQAVPELEGRRLVDIENRFEIGEQNALLSIGATLDAPLGCRATPTINQGCLPVNERIPS
jgi:hypothetical protein